MIATDVRSQAVQHIVSDIYLYSKHVIRRPLRPYQIEAARGILRSIAGGVGRTITVTISRQGGKNELSAQLEAYLLTLHQFRGGTIVKAAPTFKPQIVNSKLRLETTLDNPLTRGKASGQYGYIIRLGQARCLFFSAEPGANVVGATASLLLEFDEAQDIDPAKHDKDFAPMAASTNATRVYYGTVWDSSTLLARTAAQNEDRQRAERRPATRSAGTPSGDGGAPRLNYRFPWWVVAEHNPAYGVYAQAEKARLGDSHPLWLTQYELKEIAGTAGFLSAQQRALLAGEHPRQVAPTDEAVYVAGIDIAGPDEADADAALRAAKPRKDSTVITIARLTPSPIGDGVSEPRLELVDHYWWTGHTHRQQYEQMLAVLRDLWRCQRIAVDASGIGAGVADFLLSALGESIVEPFTFTAASKSTLGFELLSAVNGGRLKMYAPPDDEDAKAAGLEFWYEAEKARYDVRANRQIAWYVDESDGHDDFLSSLALCVHAAGSTARPNAAEVVPSTVPYADERGRF